VDAEGNSAVGQALLSSDHPYGGTVGLIDAVTPLSVFTTANGLGQFRRYGGSGSLNDAASWTRARDLGFVNQHTKLAGGPSGLFLLGSTSPGGDQLFVRKWNGTTFGPPAMLGTGGTPATQHLFQDAAGRLHAVFTVGDAGGLHLMHAVSDNGNVWRMGTVTTSSQPYAAYGNIADTRVATAPDHIGVVVWRAGNGPSEVRVAAVGPDVPATKPPSHPAGQLAFKEGTYKLSGIPACLRNGHNVRVTLSFKRAKKSGNVVLGLRRTDFFVQGTRISKDTTAPFRVTIPLFNAKVGTTYVLRARAYLKVRRGPPRTRSLSRSAKGC
jgi:hypothetical protein